MMETATIKWENKNWNWNPMDKSLLHVNDWTYDFKEALPILKNRRTAIQAGGAMGLWPYLMCQYFDFVYTYEACPDNFFYMFTNLNDVENVEAHNKALGARKGVVDVRLHQTESKNAGCYYTVESEKGNVDQVTLDDEFVDNDDIDFIALDVEGNEKKVLEGATNLIERCNPVIMLENKMLPHSSEIGHVMNDAINYLESFGYKVVKRVHRDVILKK